MHSRLISRLCPLATLLGPATAPALAQTINFTGTQTALYDLNTGTMNFYDYSSLGTGTFTNYGRLNFFDASNARLTRLVNHSLGVIDVSGHSGGLDFGSLSGTGSIVAGNTYFSIGALNESTTFSGSITGTSGLMKVGTGTLTLSGTANLSFLEIYAGTLQIGDGGTTGSVTGHIFNNAALAWNRTDAATLAQRITGTGTFTKAGTGNLTLSGDNLYTGGTTVSAGTLTATHVNALGVNRALTVASGATLSTDTLANFSVSSLSGAGTINAGSGTFTVNQGSDTIWAGDLSGTGALTKTGAGTLTLAGNNTYTGTTTVSAGTLQLGNGGTAGSVSGDIVNDAALAWNRSDAATLAQIISGSGSLTKNGTGTLTLSGANTYTGGTTVAAGALVATHANALGNTGALSVASGATLDTSALSSFAVGSLSGSGTIHAGGGVFDVIQNTDTTWAGNLTGFGRLRKTGTGTLTLSGTNSYTAATFFNEGTIVFSQLANFGPSGNLRFNGGTLRWASGNTTDISSRVVSLEAGASTFDTNGNHVTLANSIGNNGAGALRKTGTGTLTLTGANTYTGGTTLAGGTINFSSLANFGAGALTIDGGRLQWAAGTSTDISPRLTAIGASGATFDTNGNHVVFASGLSGSGTLTKTGSGTLTFGGANTTTGEIRLAGGTLALGHADALGSGGTISFSGGTLQFTAADTTDYSARFSNAAGQAYSIDITDQNLAFASALSSSGGTLTKTGNGTLTLTAANTYTGGTTVNAGTLALAGSGSLTGSIQIGGNGTLSFQDGTTAPTTAISNGGGLLFIDQASAGAATIANNSGRAITFTATATAASANITNDGAVNFTDNSTAGAATLTNNNNVYFVGNATAGSANIMSQFLGLLEFYHSASAGTANITNTLASSLNFHNSSTAGSARIINRQSSYVSFMGDSTAGSADITNESSGYLVFYDNTSAGSAHLTNQSNSYLLFLNSATGGNASVANDGTLDLSRLSSTAITFGSLSGNGYFYLGAAAVTTGGDQTSNNVAGLIADGGDWGGAGASLVKTGTGSLTLSGANTFTGGTTIAAGTLLANNPAGSATGSGFVTVQTGATLGGSGFIAGPATITGGGTLAPGNSPGTLTFTGGLQLDDGAILDFELGAASDLVRISGGVFSGPASAGSISLFIADSGGFAAGSYTLFDFAGASLQSIGATSFALNSAPSGFTYSIDQIGDTFVLTASAIPEPSTFAALAGLGALAFASTRRRRR